MHVQKFLQKYMIVFMVALLLATLPAGSILADEFHSGQVDVALSDFTNPMDWAVTVSTAVVGAKKVKFNVTNVSLSAGIPHEFVVIKTDLAPDQLPRRIDNPNAADESQLQVIARTNRLLPGETVRLKLALEPGNYVLICNIGGHYNAGMYTAFRVVE